MSGPGSSPVRDGGHRKAGISGAWNVPSIFVSRLTHGTLLHRILITRRLWDCCQSGYCRFGMQVTWATILSQTLFIWALFLRPRIVYARAGYGAAERRSGGLAVCPVV